MIICGIDTGAGGRYAWAKYDGEKILAWGEGDAGLWTPYARLPFADCDGVAIERIRTYGRSVENATFEACELVGLLWERARIESVSRVLIQRQTVAETLARRCGTKTNKAGVNAALAQLCPGFKAKNNGIDQHVKDAAAVAIVGYGMFTMGPKRTARGELS